VQIAEWYFTVKEMDAAQQVKGHVLIENWRGKNIPELSPEDTIS